MLDIDECANPYLMIHPHTGFVFQDESGNWDKTSPILVFVGYKVDYESAADSTGLLPILNQRSLTNISKQV